MTVTELIERLQEADVEPDMSVQIVMDGFSNGVGLVDVDDNRVYLYEKAETA